MRHESGDWSFGPQHPRKRLGTAACVEGGRERIPGTQSAASLDKAVSSRFNEKYGLQKLKWRITEEDT